MFYIIYDDPLVKIGKSLSKESMYNSMKGVNRHTVLEKECSNC